MLGEALTILQTIFLLLIYIRIAYISQVFSNDVFHVLSDIRDDIAKRRQVDDDLVMVLQDVDVVLTVVANKLQERVL